MLRKMRLVLLYVVLAGSIVSCIGVARTLPLVADTLNPPAPYMNWLSAAFITIMTIMPGIMFLSHRRHGSQRFSKEWWADSFINAFVWFGSLLFVVCFSSFLIILHGAWGIRICYYGLAAVVATAFIWPPGWFSASRTSAAG